MLDIWPVLPIVVCVRGRRGEDEINDNVYGALKEHDRICQVYVYVDLDYVSVFKIKELVGAMQVTFPKMTHLAINFDNPSPNRWRRAFFPETFLGGSAPNLRSLRLAHITFPALPKLLLSSPGLVNLILIAFPYSGHISSDAMVNCLSSLTRLEFLHIHFQPPDHGPDPDHPDRPSRRPPTLTHTSTVFPVLHTLRLIGETEYLDHILAHIEAPHLHDAYIEFFNPRSHDFIPIPTFPAFPASPRLLLSSPGLVGLSLVSIPCPGYISFDAIVDCLSSLPWLKHLQIESRHSHPRPDSASPHPPILTRAVFPNLSTLHLEGETEFIDQHLAHIEAPHLNDVHVRFLDPPNFDISRISSCIGHTEPFQAFDQAFMRFGDGDVEVVHVLLSLRKETGDSKRLFLTLLWTDSGWKLVKVACRPSSHPFEFSLTEYRPLIDMGITPWLEFLHVFTSSTVENLFLSMRLAICIAPAFQELAGEGVAEVLPALQTIFIRQREDSEAEIVQKVMGKFVATRELSGHPVAVDIIGWKYEKYKNYSVV